MDLDRLVFLAGLLVVPLALLAMGHRFARRSPRVRGAFWGALFAYALAALVALWVSMSPAAEWEGSDLLRGFLGFWAMLVAPLVGGTLGALRAPGRAPASPVRGRD